MLVLPCHGELKCLVFAFWLVDAHITWLSSTPRNMSFIMFEKWPVKCSPSVTEIVTLEREKWLFNRVKQGRRIQLVHLKSQETVTLSKRFLFFLLWESYYRLLSLLLLYSKRIVSIYLFSPNHRSFFLREKAMHHQPAAKKHRVFSLSEKAIQSIDAWIDDHAIWWQEYKLLLVYSIVSTSFFCTMYRVVFKVWSIRLFIQYLAFFLPVVAVHVQYVV